MSRSPGLHPPPVSPLRDSRCPGPLGRTPSAVSQPLAPPASPRVPPEPVLTAPGALPCPQRCMERLRSSRAKLLDRYRQAGDGAYGAPPGALLVQEVMEQEWQELRDRLPGLRGEQPMEQVSAASPASTPRV